MNSQKMTYSQTNSPCAPMTNPRLVVENERFRGTGGVSERNRDHGFAPAFLDHKTGRIYRSRFANGKPAPFHLLDGLPEHLVVRSRETGLLKGAGELLESGFVRFGRFYSRQEAADAVSA
jgi:hypothetical protein